MSDEIGNKPGLYLFVDNTPALEPKAPIDRTEFLADLESCGGSAVKADVEFAALLLSLVDKSTPSDAES